MVIIIEVHIYAFETINGIQHILTPQYHPASNGLAECYVQVFKDGMKKVTEGTIESRVARVLAHYQVTPQSTTGTSPAELMFGRKFHTKLNLLKLTLDVFVHQKQTKQKGLHDYYAMDRSFSEGDSVCIHNIMCTIMPVPKVDSRLHCQEDRTSILHCAVEGLTTATMPSPGMHQTLIG